MKTINPLIDLDHFFTQVGATQRRALLLDYDGTLAPFRVERHQADPYHPGVRAALTTILQARHMRLIIISGRAVRDLLPLLSLAEPLEVWGSHGWERSAPDGGYHIATWSASVAQGLAEARMSRNKSIRVPM